MKFDKSIEELNTIVEKMQDPNTSIEDAIKLYEKGMMLSKECMSILADAQNKITTIKDGLEKNFEE